MTNRRQPNPDDRSNNVERLQNMITNTERNICDTEASMEFSTPEEQQQIKAKNERRRYSIEAMKAEIQDEKEARRNGEI